MIDQRCRNLYQEPIQEFVAFVVRCLCVVGVGEFGLHVGHIGPQWWIRDEEGQRTRRRGQLLKQRNPHDREMLIEGERGGDSIVLTHDKAGAIRERQFFGTVLTKKAP